MNAAGNGSRTSSRREGRRAERREAILDVAERAFLRNGYAHTTMSSIAVQLGGSKSTLWAYFSTKEELFTAILLRTAHQLRTRLQAVIVVDACFETNLRRFCHQYISLMCSPESIAAHRLIVAETTRFPNLGKMFFEHALGAARQVLIQMVAGAIHEQIVAPQDPSVAAELLRSLCYGRCFQQLIFGLCDTVSDDEIVQDINVAIATFLRATAPAIRLERPFRDLRK
ncbi:TetR/AcrR family transcriptional regulator [Sphingobium sp. BS19]|uniref:TetR/AcrR family transcriptional regulator n=1 Tax=Sphingobium sp. BS19 TaxID=3018973 RepID=UPI00248FFBC6|nr:TetR/AcrR family transcriptional regulator [Sphingobium sp. BS19]